MTRKKRWTASFGPRGFRVRVYERHQGGPLWYQFYLGRKQVRGSLKHSDRQAAAQWARDKSEQLQAGLAGDRGALGTIVGLYQQFEVPKKSTANQGHDNRCAGMFLTLFGAEFDLHKLDSSRWETFIRQRLAGEINAHGQLVPTEDQQPVSRRTVRHDLEWLRAVCNWAKRWRKPDGRTLLQFNPVDNLTLPKEGQPRRVVATHERYEKLLEAARGQVMVVRRERTGPRRQVSSFLLELLVLCHETGRRIGAVRQLRVGDFNPELGPHGSLRWPKGTDKMGKESIVPVSEQARLALDSRLSDVSQDPQSYLFPAPFDAHKSISRAYADSLLRRAERAAGLEPLDGTLWHTWRRKYATERAHLANRKAVAQAAGWADSRTMESIYQQTTVEALFDAITQPKRVG